MARPREFEPDEALTAIKEAFWSRGYDATSLQDIEQATGLKKQSLYRLYGDKRGMYLKALDHYSAHEAAETIALLETGGTARARLQRIFDHVVDLAVAGDRRGCFFCNASIDQAPVDDETRAVVAASMETVRQSFIETLSVSPVYKASRARREKKAAGLMAAYFGLRVMVRAGLGEPHLRNVVKDALAEIG